MNIQRIKVNVVAEMAKAFRIFTGLAQHTVGYSKMEVHVHVQL